MASAVDSRLAYARLSAVATASRLPTANRGSNNSYTTSWDTTGWFASAWPDSVILSITIALATLSVIYVVSIYVVSITFITIHCDFIALISAVEWTGRKQLGEYQLPEAD